MLARMTSTTTRATMMALLAAVALGAGCGGEKDEGAGKGGGGKAGGKVASCNVPSMGTCREYRDGNLALGDDMLKRLCTGSDSATFTSSPCPTDKLVASCTKKEGKDYYYEAYPLPLADTEADCKRNEGTFATVK